MADTAITRAIELAALQRKPLAWKSTPLFDWLLVIFGGLPFYLPLLFFMGESGLAKQEPVYWYFWMNACISAPHVYATYCRLTRKIGEKRVSWLWGWPAYGSCVGALVLASWNGWFLLAMTLVNVWQSFHYTRQVYGVSKIYTKNPVDPVSERFSFAAFHLAMPLFVLGRWDMLYTIWSGKPSSAIIPINIADGFLGGCWLLAVAAAVLAVAAEYKKYQRSQAAYDPVGAINLAVYFAIFVYGFLTPTHYQRGFFAVTIYHAVQYLALVWKFERRHASGIIRRTFEVAPREIMFLVFWGALFASGFVFENYFIASGNRFWPMFSSIALAAVSAHHYTVDTVIWRRRAGS